MIVDYQSSSVGIGIVETFSVHPAPADEPTTHIAIASITMGPRYQSTVVMEPRLTATVELGGS